MSRARLFRPFAALLALGLLLALPAVAPRPAAAQTATADLAVLRLTGPHAAPSGHVVAVRITAANLGPAASQLDIALSSSAGLQLNALTCDHGISSDGWNCEYSGVAPGERVMTLAAAIVAPGAGPTETITACASNEGATEDSNAGNDCLTLTVAIVGR
jgi:hypothetical protein